MSRAAGAAPLLALWALPLALSLAFAFAGGFGGEAWTELLRDNQTWPGLALSLGTGAAAALGALALSLLILAGFHGTPAFARLGAAAAFGLALPHLAFAIGFGFLIMPSGLLARLLAGGPEPPQWVSVQDPWGLSLTAALTLKEAPFLLAIGWSALSRGDLARALAGQCAAAASLGHNAGSVWLRVVQPHLLKQLALPAAIVFSYGATVVDMALVLGPTQPPTLAAAVWRDLNDAQQSVNDRGLAGALLLTMSVTAAIVLAWLVTVAARRLMLRIYAAGPSGIPAPRAAAWLASLPMMLVYGAALAVIAALSITARWPYPDLLPSPPSPAAWAQVLGASPALWLSLALAFATSALAVTLAVLWLETQRASWDAWLAGAAVISLVLPQLVTAGGQYRLFLPLGLDGTMAGLLLAHLTPALAYALIVLIGPYRGFDQRFGDAAAALGSTPMRRLLAIKLPLLKAPLMTAAAVAFAVSLGQFVPAQLVAAGRASTLPMEAVTLSSGGSRPLTAAFALALAVPALAAFVAAGVFGRPRWR